MFEFCHRRSSLSACIHEVSVQQRVWGRHCASLTVSGRLYAVKEPRESLSRTFCVWWFSITFWNGQSHLFPQVPVCKEPLLFLPGKYLLDSSFLLVPPCSPSIKVPDWGPIRGLPRSFCSLAPLIGPCYVCLPSGRPSKSWQYSRQPV